MATLGAVGAAGRVLFSPFPGVQPVTVICLVTGASLGPRAGLAVGPIAGLLSNSFLGQGPWTPAADGALGAGGPLRGAAAAPSARARSGLAVVGFAWGFLFGWAMNVWFLASFGPDLSWASIVLVTARSLPFDLAHAARQRDPGARDRPRPAAPALALRPADTHRGRHRRARSRARARRSDRARAARSRASALSARAAAIAAAALVDHGRDLRRAWTSRSGGGRPRRRRGPARPPGPRPRSRPGGPPWPRPPPTGARGVSASGGRPSSTRARTARPDHVVGGAVVEPRLHREHVGDVGRGGEALARGPLPARGRDRHAGHHLGREPRHRDGLVEQPGDAAVEQVEVVRARRAGVQGHQGRRQVARRDARPACGSPPARRGCASGASGRSRGCGGRPARRRRTPGWPGSPGPGRAAIRGWPPWRRRRSG